MTSSALLAHRSSCWPFHVVKFFPHNHRVPDTNETRRGDFESSDQGEGGVSWTRGRWKFAKKAAAAATFGAVDTSSIISPFLLQQRSGCWSSDVFSGCSPRILMKCFSLRAHACMYFSMWTVRYRVPLIYCETCLIRKTNVDSSHMTAALRQLLTIFGDLRNKGCWLATAAESRVDAPSFGIDLPAGFASYLSRSR